MGDVWLQVPARMQALGTFVGAMKDTNAREEFLRSETHLWIDSAPSESHARMRWAQVTGERADGPFVCIGIPDMGWATWIPKQTLRKIVLALDQIERESRARPAPPWLFCEAPLGVIAHVSEEAALRSFEDELEEVEVGPKGELFGPNGEWFDDKHPVTRRATALGLYDPAHVTHKLRYLEEQQLTTLQQIVRGSLCQVDAWGHHGTLGWLPVSSDHSSELRPQQGRVYFRGRVVGADLRVSRDARYLGSLAGGLSVTVHADALTEELWARLQRHNVIGLTVPNGGDEIARRADWVQQLAAFQLSDDGVRALSANYQLRVLSVGNVSDAAFHHLRRGLEVLQVGSSRFTGEALQSFPRLREASFHGTDAGLAAVRNVPLLRSLTLRGWGVTDEGLAQLEAPGLERLDIARTAATGETLSRFPGLRRLRIRRLPAAVADLRHLEDLDLTDAAVSDLQALVNLPLRSLNLMGTAVKDLAPLATLAGLERLVLTDTPTRDRDLAAVMNLPLTELYLAATGVTSSGLASLTECTSLEALSLAMTAVESLRELVLPRLRRIDLEDSAVTSLAGATFPALQTLNLCGTPIDDAGLASIRRFRALRGIDLRRTRITDAIVPELEWLPELRWVNLAETNVSPEAKARLESTIASRYNRLSPRF
ncbi:MAG: hypothetical protein AAGE52_26150 [Myxococcota bacterium]